MGTVILGAGIIGCSTAYALSQSSTTAPDSVHLVEASPKLFASASGYAGGFLAKDWFGPGAASLGALSFELHRKLAEEHGGKEKWGYSGSRGTSLVEGRRGTGHDWLGEGASRALAAGDRNGGGGDGPGWLSTGEGGVVEVVSGEESTAQVDPLRLSQFLLDECIRRSVNLHHPAKAVSVSKDPSGRLCSVRIVSNNDTKETDVPCARLIITAGAWTPKVFSVLFPSAKVKIPITPLAGHSLIVRSPRWTKAHEAQGCHAVFTTDPSGYSPEIFSRIGGDIYLAGLNSSSIRLPTLPTDSQVDEGSIGRLRKLATRLLGAPGVDGADDDLQVVRASLCFRPVTPSGRPIIARVSDAKLGDGLVTRGGGEGGVFVSAGHGPWGITMSLGTGQVLAELVEGRPTSANVSALGL